MTYQETREVFESTPQFSSTCTLERIRKLLKLLGHPEKGQNIIHIAGTNGKGSTATMTARILEEHGLKTGLFLSPYVVTFRERVSINGEPITEEEFVRLAERVLSVADLLLDKPNFFELMTALALQYFTEKNCDYIVLEVGMGGALDATNIIPAPLVAAITPISLDHTKYLGDTTEKIAFEKCGILKPGCIAVTSAAQPKDAMDAIRLHCEKNKITLLVPQKAEHICCSLESTCFSYLGLPYRLKLLGRHQVDNACTVLSICDALREKGVPLRDEACQIAMQKATLPARLEILSHAPFCLLDGGHNPAGISALFEFLNENRNGRKVITVFGCLKDKGYTEMAQTVARSSDVTIVTACPSPRTCSYTDLAPHLRGVCHNIVDNHDALKKAYDLAQSDDLIVICGSLYLASSIKQLLS